MVRSAVVVTMLVGLGGLVLVWGFMVVVFLFGWWVFWCTRLSAWWWVAISSYVVGLLGMLLVGYRCSVCTMVFWNVFLVVSKLLRRWMSVVSTRFWCSWKACFRVLGLVFVMVVGGWLVVQFLEGLDFDRSVLGVWDLRG